MENQQKAYGIKKPAKIYFVQQSLETFCTMSRVIRFDNKSTREERRKLVKLAALRDICLAVGSLVVTASDSRPEGLVSVPDATKHPPSTHGVRAR
ncbi:hypothetical protein TNCV_4327451 [Trichonephila clavipes]|nr:hypothetical protein TNCV_4327451 [Trichonephila clavipes]